MSQIRLNWIAGQAFKEKQRGVPKVIAHQQWARLFMGGLGCWIFTELVCPAFAINIRHDVPDASYLTLGAQPQFNATVRLEVPGTDVTGTIIGDGSWVLTVAHPLDGGVTPTEVSFTKNAITYTGTQIVLHPNWTGDLLGGNDLGLVKLNTVVTGVSPAMIYTGNGELTRIGTKVGFGDTGTGAVGSTGGQGTLRGAQNVIDAFVSNSGTVITTDGANSRALFMDFDAPDSPINFLDAEGDDPPSYSGNNEALGLEGMLNTGDSGSPLFIDVGAGVWRIAGVGSATVTEEGLYGMNHPAVDERISDYGDAGVWTRVSTSSEFILSTIPEPGSAALASIGGLALAALWRRARRQPR